MCIRGYNRRMPIRSINRRLRFAWLALFAVLLNALAPTVSHALAASRPVIPVDVCSVDGGAPFAAAAALLMQDDEHAGMGPFDDCGYCLAHAGSDGLPPPAHAPLALGHGTEPRPFLFHHAPRPLPAWLAAVPRGPPAFA
jgi:hypothetical protein